jgi:hypothetical protein
VVPFENDELLLNAKPAFRYFAIAKDVNKWILLFIIIGFLSPGTSPLKGMVNPPPTKTSSF